MKSYYSVLHLLYISVMRQKAEILEKFYLIAGRIPFSVHFAEKLRTIFRECVLSVEAAQNLVVLKTIEGMAQGAAFTLDNMGDTDIVGTLAGDDTILLVFHDNVRALDFCEQVKQMLR